MKPIFLFLTLMGSTQLSYAQKGCVTGDCTNGYGTFIVSDGGKYVVTFKDGKAHGKGVFEYSDGGKYEGEFQMGKKHGEGEFVGPDGDRYVGAYLNEDRFGIGTYYYTNGDVYRGSFEFDLRHGIGVYTYADGDRYEGRYALGKTNGAGTVISADGTVTKGFWKMGEFMGANRPQLDSLETVRCEVMHTVMQEMADRFKRLEGEWKTNDETGYSFYECKVLLPPASLSFLNDGTCGFTLYDGPDRELAYKLYAEFRSMIPDCLLDYSWKEFDTDVMSTNEPTEVSGKAFTYSDWIGYDGWREKWVNDTVELTLIGSEDNYYMWISFNTGHWY